MTSSALDIIVFGLSLTSTWGNGHATTYRSLLAPMAARGNRIRFFERDMPWYAANRDLADPTWCELLLYDSLGDLTQDRSIIANADVVMVGSYVPDGREVIDDVLATARGVVAFYDIDTPVTLAQLKRDACPYLAVRQIPQFDLYLSFSGGTALQRLQLDFGARAAEALFCSVDETLYRPVAAGPPQWSLGYLGTYSQDRQPALERLLIEAAKRLPDHRFVVAGSLYPSDLRWPENVERLDHVPQPEHTRFYSSLAWTLNITRAEMVGVGFSPSVRLFEAAACGTPIISDEWQGLDRFFQPTSEIVTASDTEAVCSALTMPHARRRGIAEAARQRILSEHTGSRRAAQLEDVLLQSVRSRRVVFRELQAPCSGNRL